MSAPILRSRQSPHSSSSDEATAGTTSSRIVSSDPTEHSGTSQMTAVITQPCSVDEARDSLVTRLHGDSLHGDRLYGNRLEQLRNEGMELYRVKIGGGAYDTEMGGASVAQGGIPSADWTVLERPLCEGDTLTNLALRYNCKIDDLKRVNKIMRDQDLYALRVVRIPVLRHGVTEERLVTEDRERDEAQFCKERRRTGSCSDTDYAVTDEESDHLTSSRSRLLPRHSDSLRSASVVPSQDSKISKMFKSVDDELRSVTESLLTTDCGNEENDSLTRHRQRLRGPSHDGVSFFGGYISSRTVILLVLAVVAGVPLFFGVLFLVSSMRGAS